MKNTTLRKTAAAAMAIIMMCTGVSCGAADGGGYYASSDRSLTGDYAVRSENATAEAEMYNEDVNTEEYNHYTENPFLKVADHPLSTFSTDVDTASFTNVRRMLENGQEVYPDAVRTEEFINYFKYDYPTPQPSDPDKLSITTELSDCPWNRSAKLMLIGLQAQEVEVRQVSTNIVFLIDVSGSMYSEDKLPLVQQAFSMLAENLGANDRVSIVTYAGSDEVVLEGESGKNYRTIADALNGLEAGGSTAGAAGIVTAYDIAEKYFIEGGNNRVILATDGDLNVGVSSEDGLKNLIEQKRDKGVFLSVLGFGMGNYKDNKLEALADNGNGNYAYIDSIDEARRVLVTEMSGTLFTVAKDAKVQVEFNPRNVDSYRLVGYENRLLADEDFEDDTRDAGDIGAGQQVTVLYELIPAGSAEAVSEENQDEEKRTLKYQEDVEYPAPEKQPEATLDGLDGELLTVSVRYKEPDEDESKLIEKPVEVAGYVAADNISDNMKLACAAAMTAKTLGNSEQKYTTEQIREYVNGIALDSGELEKMLDKMENR